jgi:hypothetical protein
MQPRLCLLCNSASSSSHTTFPDASQFPRMVDLKEVGHCLLRGFSIAHAKIIEGKTEIFEAGTTTLLGGVVLELIDADKQGRVGRSYSAGCGYDCDCV